MRHVHEQDSTCGGYRLRQLRDFRAEGLVQHAVLLRAADGAVLLDLTDPGCCVHGCFFDEAKPDRAHVLISRVDGTLPMAHFQVDLAAGTWELLAGDPESQVRGDLTGLHDIARGAPLPCAASALPPSPPPAVEVDLDELLLKLPPVGSPSDVVRTFGELELAPRRRYRVLAPIPVHACRDLAVGEVVTFLRSSFFARESGYQLQFAGGPRQWFELRLSDDDPRDSALLGSLHRHLAPA